jgi:arylsulfatase A-like enzyme
MAAAAPKPNVVVIMTDDQTQESLRVMPQTLDRLAARGTVFTDSVVSFSACAPSRATALTARYAHNHGILLADTAADSYGKLDPPDTLPVALQHAGYHTGHVGKYVNGYGVRDPTEVPPGWDVWRGLVDPTTAHYWNYTVNEDGVLRNYGDAVADYQTDVLARYAVDTVARLVALGQPFYLQVTPFAPHDEATFGITPPRPAPRDAEAFAHEPLPMPPSFDEADVSDKPHFVRILPLLDGTAIAAVAAHYRARLASLLAVDDLVAHVVDAIDSAGLAHHTIVVFTSDNGFMTGEHRFPSGKLYHYRESLGVPLVVRGPGFPVRRTDRLASNVDLASTLALKTGARREDAVDGRRLSPKCQRGNAVMLEGWPGAPGRLFQEGLRTARYRYTEYSWGETELYDRKIDPYELESRHDDPHYARARQALHNLLRRMRRCVGPECRPDPRLALAVADDATTGDLRAQVDGVDERLIRSVVFKANPHRGGIVVENPPFVMVTSRPVTVLAARVELWDGRTLDLGARCPSRTP